MRITPNRTKTRVPIPLEISESSGQIHRPQQSFAVIKIKHPPPSFQTFILVPDSTPEAMMLVKGRAHPRALGVRGGASIFKARFTQDTEHPATPEHKLWNTLHSKWEVFTCK